MKINKLYLLLDLVAIFLKPFIFPQDKVIDKFVLGEWKTPDFYQIDDLEIKLLFR